MGQRGVEENWLHLRLDCDARPLSQHKLQSLRHRGDACGTKAVVRGETLRGQARGQEDRVSGLRTSQPVRTRLCLQRLETYRQGTLVHRTHWSWALAVPLLSWATPGLLC